MVMVAFPSPTGQQTVVQKVWRHPVRHHGQHLWLRHRILPPEGHRPPLGREALPAVLQDVPQRDCQQDSLHWGDSVRGLPLVERSAAPCRPMRHSQLAPLLLLSKPEELPSVLRLKAAGPSSGTKHRGSKKGLRGCSCREEKTLGEPFPHSLPALSGEEEEARHLKKYLMELKECDNLYVTPTGSPSKACAISLWEAL